MWIKICHLETKLYGEGRMATLGQNLLVMKLLFNPNLVSNTCNQNLVSNICNQNLVSNICSQKLLTFLDQCLFLEY